MRNFTDKGEIGASLCIHHQGRAVVDLWGGNASETKPWEENTVSLVFSATKGATALAAHMLVERGELDLHKPISHYWPEFAQAGKQDATVLMALNHSVGLPGLREPVSQWAFEDWDFMVDALAREEPFWEPGTRNGYHLLTFGWTVGELVRRVSGKSLGAFFREELAEPYALDFAIGQKEGDEDRVAHIQPFEHRDMSNVVEFERMCLEQPESLPARAMINSGGYSPVLRDEETGRCIPDTPRARRAELGGAGGVTNARGLARLYALVAQPDAGPYSADLVSRMGQVSMATQRDAILQIPTRFALGFMKSLDNHHLPLGHILSAVLGDRAFGHVGAGGSIGFADPGAGMSFGYTMNKMGPGIWLNERGQSLVDAAYKCLGYRSRASGVWIR
ncbi:MULTISPECIES: serine hydrolase domain-containing protein [Sphingobium]|uniref:serine hydrolase domain-containing protein n=1 Tax=Sphingobium TaxID=165695 RepID=UPI001C3F59DA|nr:MULTISPECIES: serine hydrolase domain-containing protein [unclassified Sphingobium]